MKKFTASANIQANPDSIWRILTDRESYPSWDPAAIRIEGAIELGGKVTAYTKLSPDRAFPVRVTEFVPGRRMTWQGGMPLGLFKGVRTFTLEPRKDGSVDFTLSEEFRGLLSPLITRSIPDLTSTFEESVAGLKAYAEKAP